MSDYTFVSNICAGIYYRKKTNKNLNNFTFKWVKNDILIYG